MKITAASLLLIVLIIVPAHYSSAGNEEVYTVDFEKWPPFRIEDKEIPEGFKGLDIEILNELSKKLNIKIQIKRSPWARSLANLKSGDSDIITGVAYTDERAEYINYAEPSYYSVNPVFYVKKGRGRLIKNYNDLYSYSIGYSIKSAYFEPFNSDTKLKKIELSSETHLIKMLMLGRVDAIIGTEPNISYDLIKSGNKSKVEPVLYKPDKKTKLFIGVSKKSPLASRMKEIEKVINDMLNEKKIERLMKKYQ
jgi:polar amino acid transport system substrate-binding protein